jgi:hypothetical protein
VWEDINGNGLQDSGEAGIGGVTVQLRDPQGNLVQTTTTDAAGKYSFTVNAGSYFVSVVAPAGYAPTEPDVGADDTVDSDVDGTGRSATVTVAAGDVNNTIDAGLYRTAEIGNRVWLDVNGNGVQDAGEAGVQGVQVRLLDANGNAVDGPIATDANGNYLSRASSRASIASPSIPPPCLPAIASPPAMPVPMAPTPTRTAGRHHHPDRTGIGRIGPDLGRRHRRQSRFHLGHRD